MELNFYLKKSKANSCVLVCLLFISPIMTDSFKSMIDLELIFESEKKFPLIMETYLKAERNRLQLIKNLAEEFISKQFVNHKNIEGFLDNPVNIFHLIKRLTVDAEPVLNLMRNTNSTNELLNKMINGSLKLPEEEDLNWISMAIGRLQTVYKINTSNLASGIITSTVKATKEFSADDCFEIGRQLYLKDHFLKAIPWFEEALRRESKWTLESDKKELLLEYLAESFVVAGNKSQALHIIDELYKLNPNSTPADLLIGEIEDGVGATLIQDKSIVEGMSYIEDKWQRLCRKEQITSTKKESELKCYYSNSNSPYLILQPVKIEDLHLKPWLALFYDVVTKDEMELIKNLSATKLQPSITLTGNTANYRTSKSHWLKDIDHPTVLRISKRLQEMTGLDLLNSSEALQVVNYGSGGHYEPHVDYASHNREHLFQETGNRMATVLIYLNDVISGGLTVFPYLGISITPTKGAAAFWYNVLKTGRGDYKTEPSACPVLAGSKWVSNKWIHTFHQEFRKPCGLHQSELYYESHVKN